jgi:PilZ domain
MFADLDSDGIHWSSLAAPAIGVLATVLAFLVGWWLLRRREQAPRRPRPAPLPPVVDPPPRGKVDLATDPFVQGSVMDRRSALRRRGNPVAVLISNEEAESPPEQGWVIDRSVGGLCLSVSKQFEPESIVSVRTATAPEACPWIQLHVRSCRQIGKEWELGCQFVRTPPWSVLLLFG